MAKTKNQKKDLVEAYRAWLQETQTVYVVRPNGLTPNETVALKKELFDLGATFNVVKNSLFQIALKEEGLPELETLSSGQHAILFSSDQVSETAKVLKKYVKDTEKIEIIAGLLKGDAISGSQIEELADLPSKDQLIGQLLSVFNGPVRGFVTVLNGNTRELVQVLNAIKEVKSE